LCQRWGYVLKALVGKIQKIVGKDNVTTTREDLACYAYDATTRYYCPDLVVFPENTRHVASVMALAHANGLPVIPRGAGTGMTGGALAVRGGMVMVLSRFNRIMSVDRLNLVAEVEPGVVTGQFQEVVEAQGLFYPPDPSSAAYSTLGGNVAEGAGGPRAVKYGVTRDYVLGLEVVLPSGEVISTGVRTAKGVVGYDLTRLIVGSEGTLGIITKIILKLLPLPEGIRTVCAVFDHMDDAARSVSEIMCSGVIPRTVEYMDHAALACTEAYLKMGLPTDAEAMLLIDVDGSATGVEMAIRHIKAICGNRGVRKITVAKSSQEAATLWKARKSISPALFRLGPDKINEDIVVPRSRIPEMVAWIDDLRRRTGLQMVTFGHAGDGNIHFNIMLDKNDKAVLDKAEAAVEELFRHTLRLGGTISGEHGVGITKAAYVPMELGEEEIALMRRIKAAFDPKGILNPGKMFMDPPAASPHDR